MIELKRAIYKGEHLGLTFDIRCWEGDSLDFVWNQNKSYYLAGDRVTITDNHGKSKTFTKGFI